MTTAWLFSRCFPRKCFGVREHRIELRCRGDNEQRLSRHQRWISDAKVLMCLPTSNKLGNWNVKICPKTQPGRVATQHGTISSYRPNSSQVICGRKNIKPEIAEGNWTRTSLSQTNRTQYVDGIYRPKYYTVTLKSRLKVTQGHWKRNHWTDHTRLTISRVIWRQLLSCSWNVGYRSLKIIESNIRFP